MASRSNMTTNISNSKKLIVHLLDCSQIEVPINNKLSVDDVLQCVASNLSLTDTKYFGLCYHNEDSNNNNNNNNFYHNNNYNGNSCLNQIVNREWMSNERKITDYDQSHVQLSIRNYTDICNISDLMVIQQFYLQARRLLAQNLLVCSSDVIFQLSSLALQYEDGDYTCSQSACESIKRLNLLPTSVLLEHLSIQHCEEKIITRYKELSGMQSHISIANYMKLVEQLPAYGQHFFKVRDKCGLPWLLAVGGKGLHVYDYNDLKVPRKEFLWKQINDLHHKEKKFVMTVGPCPDSTAPVTPSPHYNIRLKHFSLIDFASSVNKSHNSSNNVSSAIPWFCNSSQQAKLLWDTAVQQYKFIRQQQAYFEQQRQQLSNMVFSSSLVNGIQSKESTPPPQNISQSELSSSSQSLSSSRSSNVESSSSRSSELNLIKSFSDKTELLESLKLKKRQLDDKLKEKIETYRQLCVQEAAITRIPSSEFEDVSLVLVTLKSSTASSTPNVASVGKSDRHAPLLTRRKLGNSFFLSPKFMQKNYLQTPPTELDRMELELDLQDKITAAALTLAQEKSIRKSIRKKRIQSYQQANRKLQEMEAKLMNLKKSDLCEGGQKTGRDHQIHSSGNHGGDVASAALPGDDGPKDDGDECKNVKHRAVTALTRPSNHHHHHHPSSSLSMSALSRLADFSKNCSICENEASPSESNVRPTSAISLSSSTMSSSLSSSATSSSLSSHMSCTTSFKASSSIIASDVLNSCCANNNTDNNNNNNIGNNSQQQQRLGYIPNSLYKTRTQYRTLTYPTLVPDNETNNTFHHYDVSHTNINNINNANNVSRHYNNNSTTTSTTTTTTTNINSNKDVDHSNNNNSITGDDESNDGCGGVSDIEGRTHVSSVMMQDLQNLQMSGKELTCTVRASCSTNHILSIRTCSTGLNNDVNNKSGSIGAANNCNNTNNNSLYCNSSLPTSVPTVLSIYINNNNTNSNCVVDDPSQPRQPHCRINNNSSSTSIVQRCETLDDDSLATDNSKVANDAAVTDQLVTENNFYSIRRNELKYCRNSEEMLNSSAMYESPSYDTPVFSETTFDSPNAGENKSDETLKNDSTSSSTATIAATTTMQSLSRVASKRETLSAVARVLISPRNPTKPSPCHLPAPQHAPQLSKKGKPFFVYSPDSFVFQNLLQSDFYDNTNNSCGDNTCDNSNNDDESKQRFSYSEKLTRLRVGGLHNPQVLVMKTSRPQNSSNNSSCISNNSNNILIQTTSSSNNVTS